MKYGTLALFIGAATLGAQALGQVVITIPDGSFEGIDETVSAPPLGGINNGTIGAWSATAFVLAGLGVNLDSGTHPAGPPKPLGSSFDLQVNLPLGLVGGGSISQ